MDPPLEKVLELARGIKDEQLWTLYKLLQAVDKNDLYFKEVEKIVMQMVAKHHPPFKRHFQLY